MELCPFYAGGDQGNLFHDLCTYKYLCKSFFIRFVGGGQSGFGPFLNSGVHCVMYLYYFLAACGPSVQTYLWWKRYLTTMQMVQFVLVFLHALQVCLNLIHTKDYVT